jgi:hypothetical protein
MALRRPRPEPEPEPGRTLPQPAHSVEPTDWRMYCDLLQDAGAPEEEWRRAGRIADSLAGDVRLVLIAACAAEHLGNHYLRVGKDWFIGADGTYLDNYDPLVWWRETWVRAGFRRYPTTARKRPVKRLIALNLGTPWQLAHPRFEFLRERPQHAALVAAFFDAHALPEIPAGYL